MNLNDVITITKISGKNPPVGTYVLGIAPYLNEADYQGFKDCSIGSNMFGQQVPTVWYPDEYYGRTIKFKFTVGFDCFENCLTCETFKKNSTYFSCSSCDDNNIFYEKSSNCLNCSYIDKYVNYYQYKCIDTIPDGYFLSNSQTKTIDKCYITCKHCDEQGNSEDHKCTECAEAYPYNFNNGQKCLDDCKKENLYLESENNICYRDCSNNILNDKIYNYDY